jgi:uncharacterized protein (TIGR02145 family)
MSLPTSGQLSLGLIRRELNITNTSFSLNLAEYGSYAPINSMSILKPNMVQYDAISEWYGYNHSTETLCKAGSANCEYTYRQMGVFNMDISSGSVQIDLTLRGAGDPVDFYVLYPITADWSTATVLASSVTTTTRAYYQFNYNATYGTNIAIGILNTTNQNLGGPGIFLITVTCPDKAPTVRTDNPTNILAPNATGNGTVLTQGSSAVVDRGIVLGDSHMINPDLTTNIGVFRSGSGLGAFNANLSGISPGVTYYVRAYATNAGGSTGYGNSLVLIYLKTTVICSLNWVVENLSIITYNNGDPIPLVTNAATWAGLTTGAYCYVNGNSANTGAYGLLYNRYALEDPRGMIPSGYRIMDYYDSKQCFDPLTGLGGAIKQIGTSYWLSPNTGATNITGFGALGSGYRDSSGTYTSFQQEARFWTSQQFVVPPFSGNNRFSLYYNSTAIVYQSDADPRLGYSVRIIRL